MTAQPLIHPSVSGIRSQFGVTQISFDGWVNRIVIDGVTIQYVRRSGNQWDVFDVSPASGKRRLGEDDRRHAVEAAGSMLDDLMTKLGDIIP